MRRCEGRLSSGAPPPPAARSLGGLTGSATHVPWARVCGGGGPALSLGLYALWGLRAARMVGVVSGGAWPSTVVRGVWHQALSLSWPPALWGVPPGFRDPCVLGAFGVRVGTQHRFQSVRPCEPLLRAVGVAGGVSGGVLFTISPGRLSSGAPSPPAARPLGVLSGSATHVLWARVYGCWGPARTVPLACVPCGDCMSRGWSGAVPEGGWPSTVVRGVWCHALSLPQPPALWGGQPGFRNPCVPGTVGVGVGTQQRPHSVRPCELSLRVAGVAEGRPRGGCLAPL